MDTILNNNLYSNHFFVEVNDITALQDSGNIAVNLPYKDSSEIYYGKNIKFDSLDNYVYYGELNPCDVRSGFIHLLSKRGNIFGQINLGREIFDLQDLGGNKNILIEIDTSLIYTEKECIIPDSTTTDSLKNGPKANPRSGHSHCPVRVLVLYTAAAEDAVADIEDRADMLMQQTIDAGNNSDADVFFELAGIEELVGFTEIVDLTTAQSTNQSFIDTHEAMFNNQDINIARENAQADLVVLLTDGNWQFTTALGVQTWLGRAGRNQLEDFDQADAAFAMAEADGGGANFTFTHEIGHLFGCKHEGDDNDDGPLVFDAQAHIFYVGLWFFNTNRKVTVVTQARDIRGGERILYFSNPDVEYKNEPTGIVDTRENEDQISNWACVISEFEDFVPEFSTHISGPRFADNSGTYTWCAEIDACTNVTNINWEASYDGFNYFSLNSSTNCITRSMPFNSSIYFRVTVTCNGTETETAFFYVTNTDSEGPCEIENELTDTETEITDVNMSLSPNPVQDLIIVNISPSNEAYTEYEIINSNGQVIISYSRKEISTPDNSLMLNVGHLAPGYYILRSKSNSNSLSKPFIKQ